MRVRLFAAPVLVLGLVVLAPPALRLVADRSAGPVAGNPACEQDFPSTTSPDPRVTVVMCGLDNPRGLAFFERRRGNDHHEQNREDEYGWVSDAALYVAEAGRGAQDPSTSTECFTGQASPTANNRCYGPTGAISRLWKAVQKRVVSQLPSHASRLGRQAIGPHDIAFVDGRQRDHGDRGRGDSGNCDPACAYVTIGLQQPPALRGLAFMHDFAKLLRISGSGKLRYVADFAKHEVGNNPDGRQFDTNPYGLLAETRTALRRKSTW